MLSAIRKNRVLKNIKRSFSSLKPSFERMYVLEQSLNSLELTKSKSDLDLITGSKIEDVESLIVQRPQWYRNWAQKRFDEGNVCFGLAKDNKIVSCIWTSYESAYLPNVDYNLILPKEIVSVLDGWTSPAYRKQGLYSSVMEHCLDYFRKHSNYVGVYFFIRPENLISLSIHKHLEVVFYIRLMKIFPFKFRKIKQLNCTIESMMGNKFK